MVSVLVVDDHADSAQAMGILLERSGYVITVALTYKAAIEAARGIRFEVVIADIGLPDGDGCDLLAEIRGRYPIIGIACTGYSDQASLERCKKAGFNYQLIKPVELMQLEAVMALATALLHTEQTTANPDSLSST